MIVFEYRKFPGLAGKISAFDDEKPKLGEIGYLSWNGSPATQSALHADQPRQPYEIEYVHVNPGYRGRGIATAMLTEASKYAPIVHSARRTLVGEAWARSTGEDLPECACGCSIRHLKQVQEAARLGRRLS